MSVKVTIEHGGGMFARTLEIHRLSPAGNRSEAAWPEYHERVHEYAVVLRSSGRIVKEATFDHRYGDDLLTHVLDAINALGGPMDASAQR